MVGEGRQKRLSDNVAQLVAEILNTELKEPLPALVTVTGATVGRDLQTAKVYYTVMGDPESTRQTVLRLRRVSTFVQREIGHRLHLRVTPALTFEYDDRTEKSADVLRLLAQLRENEGHKDSHS